MGGARIAIELGGFSIEKEGKAVAQFHFGEGDWTVDLHDPRVPPFDPGVTAFSLGMNRAEMGNPRVTSLDAAGRDMDRDLLGFPKDPNADVVLGTNTDLSGNVSIRWGLLHAHSAFISDAEARSLIEHAFGSGVEVRRFADVSGALSEGRALRTRISPNRADATLEVTPLPPPGR